MAATVHSVVVNGFTDSAPRTDSLQEPEVICCHSEIWCVNIFRILCLCQNISPLALLITTTIFF